jgi:hypothetical protein
LTRQALSVEAVSDGETRAVVGEDEVAVTEGTGGLGHLRDRAPPVGPVGVAVAVTHQEPSQLLCRALQHGALASFQVPQIGRGVALEGL